MLPGMNTGLAGAAVRVGDVGRAGRERARRALAMHAQLPARRALELGDVVRDVVDLARRAGNARPQHGGDRGPRTRCVITWRLAQAKLAAARIAAR